MGINKAGGADSDISGDLGQELEGIQGVIDPNHDDEADLKLAGTGVYVYPDGGKTIFADRCPTGG